ncbi:MAG: pyridoxamine 5'-phosphate oxidase family protein [Bacteroidales bacterium]|nr:pyridoxamine 5'-phosphate oxidase family protein [Bacteroidales bacterium]
MNHYHLHNRPNREIKNSAEIQRILTNGKYSTISMCRENEPYIVTLSYGYDAENQSLYFHCATKGLKLNFLSSNKKVCATVIEDGGYISDECGHEYKSVVFWGDMQPVDDPDEKKYGMNILLHHLENKDSVIKEKILKSDESYSKMEILRLDIIHIHGKAGR